MRGDVCVGVMCEGEMYVGVMCEGEMCAFPPYMATSR